METVLVIAGTVSTLLAAVGANVPRVPQLNLFALGVGLWMVARLIAVL